MYNSNCASPASDDETVHRQVNKQPGQDPRQSGKGKFSSRKTPKMAINRDFPGLRAFSANFARDKIEEREIPHPMVKSAARFGAPKPSYGHFGHAAGHGRGKFSNPALLIFRPKWRKPISAFGTIPQGPGKLFCQLKIRSDQIRRYPLGSRVSRLDHETAEIWSQSTQTRLTGDTAARSTVGTKRTVAQTSFAAHVPQSAETLQGSFVGGGLEEVAGQGWEVFCQRWRLERAKNRGE